MKIKIGFLTSGNGEKIQAVKEAIDNNILDAEIVFVGADRDCSALTWAARSLIPFWFVDYNEIIKRCSDIRNAKLPENLKLEKIFKKQKIFPRNNGAQYKYLFPRLEAENKMLKKIKKNLKFNILILDNFSRLLTPYFIDEINTDQKKPKILNISQELFPFSKRITATKILGNSETL